LPILLLGNGIGACFEWFDSDPHDGPIAATRQRSRRVFVKKKCNMTKISTNRHLPAALVLYALAILGTAPAVAQAASSTNENGEGAYARASASIAMPDWFGVAQKPHWQAPDLETQIRRSISGSAEPDEFGAEFGYYPGG
jgi:hypothetical protein